MKKLSINEKKEQQLDYHYVKGCIEYKNLLDDKKILTYGESAKLQGMKVDFEKEIYKVCVEGVKERKKDLVKKSAVDLGVGGIAGLMGIVSGAIKMAIDAGSTTKEFYKLMDVVEKLKEAGFNTDRK